MNRFPASKIWPGIRLGRQEPPKAAEPQVSAHDAFLAATVRLVNETGDDNALATLVGSLVAIVERAGKVRGIDTSKQIRIESSPRAVIVEEATE